MSDDFFGPNTGSMSLADFLQGTKPKKTKKETTEIQKAILEIANRIALEDSIEREAKVTRVASIVLGPDLDNSGDWFVNVIFDSKPVPKDNNTLSMIMGIAPAGALRKQAIFKSFDQATAWLEKNNYFNLNRTKYFEGVYASWDK